MKRYKQWTTTDRAVLRQLIEKGISIEDIATRFGRSERSIELQIRRWHKATIPHTAVCPACELSKPLDQFVKDSRSVTGHGPLCLQCKAEQVKTYYAKRRAELKRLRAAVKRMKKAKHA